MNELITKVEKWAKDKGLDQADSPEKQFEYVKDFPHHVVTRNGEVVVLSYIDARGQLRKARILQQRLNTDGYPIVKLTYFGKKKTAKVHRLVAEAFIPNLENKETVNHIDGNKINSHISNLEWADRSEQLYHAYAMGLKKYPVVAKTAVKAKNGKPVKCYEKETGVTRYFLSARDCSKHYGYSERWCDKNISEMNGNTRKFIFEYVSIEEVKENVDKITVSTLVDLVKLWAVERGLHNTPPEKQFLKVAEETAEIAAGMLRGNMEAVKDGIGDVIVTLIILSMQKGTNVQECLEMAYNEIKGRTRKMVDGVFVKSSDLEDSK